MIKQSQKTRKSERKVRIIAAFRKANGTIKAQVKNDEELSYFVTISKYGTMCKRWDGKECKGHEHTGHCYHVAAIQQISHLLGKDGIDTDALAAENDTSYRQAVDALCDDSYKQLAIAKRQWAEQWAPKLNLTVEKLLSMGIGEYKPLIDAYEVKQQVQRKPRDLGERGNLNRSSFANVLLNK